eukprot:NODE_2086_length_1515_cov_120.660920_g1985_i0.p1 GENE.NODE_2086_length_1515_cov_120.660920_g1985_i0~~NODE_2086_length_1515_cov_120.660920_g1985_i0.p1  ORF type:complete len:429 (+),score=58.98 NODE_2086_length_1515_cov_120.660920_g1985_i0:55-1287(+)
MDLQWDLDWAEYALDTKPMAISGTPPSFSWAEMGDYECEMDQFGANKKKAVGLNGRPRAQRKVNTPPMLATAPPVAFSLPSPASPLSPISPTSPMGMSSAYSLPQNDPFENPGEEKRWWRAGKQHKHDKKHLHAAALSRTPSTSSASPISGVDNTVANSSRRSALQGPDCTLDCFFCRRWCFYIPPEVDSIPAEAQSDDTLNNMLAEDSSVDLDSPTIERHLCPVSEDDTIKSRQLARAPSLPPSKTFGCYEVFGEIVQYLDALDLIVARCVCTQFWRGCSELLYFGILEVETSARYFGTKVVNIERGLRTQHEAHEQLRLIEKAYKRKVAKSKKQASAPAILSACQARSGLCTPSTPDGTDLRFPFCTATLKGLRSKQAVMTFGLRGQPLFNAQWDLGTSLKRTSKIAH